MVIDIARSSVVPRASGGLARAGLPPARAAHCGPDPAAQVHWSNRLGSFPDIWNAARTVGFVFQCCCGAEDGCRKCQMNAPAASRSISQPKIWQPLRTSSLKAAIQPRQLRCANCCGEDWRTPKKRRRRNRLRPGRAGKQKPRRQETPGPVARQFIGWECSNRCLTLPAPGSGAR